MTSFYLCLQENCNKKYKTKEKLVDHVLKIHKIIVDDISTLKPVQITKDNKKSIENQRNIFLKAEKQNSERLEIERLRALEIAVKEHAEKNYLEQYKQEQIEYYKQLELYKYRLETERYQYEQKVLETNQNYLKIIETVQKRIKDVNNINECCICADNMADTAPIPCGHKNFCFTCLDNYRKNFSSNGCTVCKGKINDIIKIYQ